MDNIKTGNIGRTGFHEFKPLFKRGNLSKRLIAGLFGILLILAAVSRTHSQSTLDATFNPNVNGGVSAIAVQPDGKILIGGVFTSVGGQTRNRIARLNANGTLDANFNPDVASTEASVLAIVVLPEGKILIGGDFAAVGGETRNHIARLNANGRPDSTFNPNANGYVSTIAVQSNGGVLIGGAFTGVGGRLHNRIARLNDNVVTDFDTNATGNVQAIALQADGKILIGAASPGFGGGFTAVDGQTRNGIARLNATLVRPPCIQQPSGMVYWNKGEGSIIDATGNQDSHIFRPHLNSFNGTYAAGKIGQAMVFNGTNQSFSGDYGATLSNSVAREITVAAWINPTTVSGQRTIISRYDFGDYLSDDGISFHFSANGGRLQFQVNQSDTISRSFITANTVLSAGVYQHVAATFNTATQAMEIFVNGVSVTLSPVNAGTVGSVRGYFTSLHLGSLATSGNSFQNTQFFGGQIDEMQIYNRVLSSSEIQTIYNAVSVSLCLNSEVSGRIRTSTNRELGDVPVVTVNRLKTAQRLFSAVHLPSAEYSLFLEQDLNDTITPIFSTHNFSPETYSFNPLTANQPGKNFTGTLINNNFAAAVPLTGESGEIRGNNEDATRETGEPLHAGVIGGTSVWYRWRAPRNGTFTFSLGGSSFDTLLAVYRGTNVANLSLVVANDNIPNVAGFSQVTFQAAAAVDYYIAVDGRAQGDGSGNFKMLYRPADYTPGVTISGIVTGENPSGSLAPSQGVTIKAENLDGAIIASTVTAANGTYSIVIPQGITVFDLTAFDDRFVDNFKSFSNVTNNQTHNFRMLRKGFNNLNAVGKIYGIGSSSNLTLTAAGTGSTVNCVISASATAGEFNFVCPELLPNGTYTLTPSQPSSMFTPESVTLTNIRSNVAGISFVNSSSGFTISGAVTRGGTPLGGVAININNAVVETDANGNYSVRLPAGGNYSVTASLPGFSFETPTVSFPNLQSNQTANFSASSNCSYTISPLQQNIPAAAGFYSFNISADTVCPWEANTNSAGFTVTSPFSYGSGTVSYFVEANTGAARTGTITVAGQTVIINQAAAPSARGVLYDFDGDRKSDIGVFRPETGAWYLQQSRDGFAAVQFGIATDRIVPADYDGDGRADVAVYRSGIWYLQRSRDGFSGVAFGSADDLPVPADFDGDGKADLAVFRPSNGVWYLLQSRDGFTAVQFGQNGDKPVTGDFDGDGKADLAVYRNGNWYQLQSQLGFTAVQFGISTDKPVVGDYDGDGKTDVAVYRPENGAWYVLQSRDGFTAVQFGISTDKPTPADYDGDGKTDIAVYRPENGAWYVLQSRNGFTGIGFGIATDKPVSGAFVP